MRLHEYEAKKLFQQQEIVTPSGAIARKQEEVEEIARSIGKPVMIKAQILVGGSGKSGEILSAEIRQQVRLVEKLL